MKKGPRRVKKTAIQLDKEMEDYRAAAETFDIKNNTS
jgi:THO complex subunit 4